MATAPTLDLVPAETTSSTDIAIIVARTPQIVLVDKDQRASLYAHIEREIAEFEPDVSTKKGREAIKSLAFKIIKTKTAIDAAGKQLNEEARAKINVVDEARRDARNTLDILAERVRKPLTDWEKAEDARVALCREWIEDFKQDAIIRLEDTADDVRKRGDHVWSRELDPAMFGDMLPEAESAKAAAVESLKAALARLIREEADREELAKLRAEREEAERVAAEKAAAEESERQRAEAERLADERRVAAEKAEADRIERAQQEAAAKAQREAEEASQAERDRIQREHDEALAAERRRADDAERLAQEERDRLAREKAETARRAADQQHRAEVKRAAKEAIMSCGADEETARKIVIAVLANEIPNMKLEF